ncbi:protein CURVATURE THYLAKOID 1D, chloroplastic-like [Gossypium australe]|uniref:Protein CURVATURE THYLAKOID 1D, chloroplastic-like n=1 Tax=Gossypium australe TaxID=47621 RepID=A0A5B6WFV5_9ROSI|nr:protein CURVATURE THYLAKOID 1D, chloroplastic-like [Gossypium australe]
MDSSPADSSRESCPIYSIYESKYQGTLAGVKNSLIISGFTVHRNGSSEQGGWSNPIDVMSLSSLNCELCWWWQSSILVSDMLGN